MSSVHTGTPEIARESDNVSPEKELSRSYLSKAPRCSGSNHTVDRRFDFPTHKGE